jgi:cytochrome oxidase Cu insertion factor (SCO1/SenC/PrrC family)
MVQVQDELAADFGAKVVFVSISLDPAHDTLEADGSLVTKDELMSRVWPGIIVAEENLKVQIAALRKALGEDRDLIRTEFGRGYRFTATVRSTVTGSDCQRTRRRGHRSSQKLVPQWISQRSPRAWCVPRSRWRTL